MGVQNENCGPRSPSRGSYSYDAPEHAVRTMVVLKSRAEKNPVEVKALSIIYDMLYKLNIGRLRLPRGNKQRE